MKVSVMGTGYVGLVTGVCLAEIGHRVICMDLDESKIEMLRKGIPHIYEPGLKELIISNVKAGRLEFTAEPELAVKNSKVIIITVGTPPRENGEADMSQVDSAAAYIGRFMNSYKLVVNKSTVPVGTADRVASIIETCAGSNAKFKFDVVSNPEFLREGNAISDTFNGDRIVIGGKSKKAVDMVRKLYAPLNIPYFVTDPQSAEMIKYSSNAFLATKISFINEIANLCEKVGANVKDVSCGMGLDKRIGRSFLNAGIGYGGSCFPKDVSSLIKIGENAGCELKILKQVIDVNKIQRIRTIAILEGLMGDLKDRDIALLGLSFKAGTDDVREAPSLYVIETLLNKGAVIKVYDPEAMENTRKIFGDAILYCKDPYEAVKGCEAAVLLTEWPEFKELNFKKIKMSMKNGIVIDGRNYLDAAELVNIGFDYFPIGICPQKADNKKVPRQAAAKKVSGFGLRRMRPAKPAILF
ncbi:MAG: UDP-glucose/GDP-mannose dehydrogenase family protein [Clostridiaceae bacterium]|nr:UDP-glucose/GDP-mannose dehydrogenase family protein [Clostridiaceae bacterium]